VPKKEAAVTSFTFSAEQVNSAPPEVRQWMVNEISATLLALTKAHREPPPHSPQLAACTLDEAVQVFELIRHDFATAQVFLELGRETPIGNTGQSVIAVNIGDIMRHTRLGDGRLFECLQTISQIFQQVRNDSGAALFGFDQGSHLYLNEATHQNIRNLWGELVRLRTPASAGDMPVAPPLSGFVPPHLGPSEDIATHAHS
jgi:hypothetical protein